MPTSQLPSTVDDLMKFAKKYEKSLNQCYVYGTAGFRMKAELMRPVAFRIGILAALLSASFQGKAVGVMVTASHNPVEDNGVKLVNPEGEMIVGEWETIATELANVPESELAALIKTICLKMDIGPSVDRVSVAVARDTRPSGAELCKIIEEGSSATVKEVFSNAEFQFKDLDLQTTPQFHFSVKQLNCEPPNLAVDYFDTLSTAFQEFLRGKGLCGQLVIDGANGIGALASKKLVEGIPPSVNFDPIIINGGCGENEVLNELCGADFVKLHVKEPNGIDSAWKVRDFRFVSLDGDADRLVYFYFDQESKDFRLLDGDRIAVIFAMYLRKLFESEAGVVENQRGLAQQLKSLNLGVVQTAYANGASTEFLESLGISVDMACTGVKNLHHLAVEKYDVGIYFEANGHGTIKFSPKAMGLFQELGGKLALLPRLINQCVGDALSDLLFVEAILAEEGMSLQQWSSLYTELPSRQLKVKVVDRTIFRTIDADTKLAAPGGLQLKIDAAISKYARARAFARPSGTEDVVRVYAEAATSQQADALAEEIAKLLQ